MTRASSSDWLVRLGFGQHILNGLTVGVTVGAVTLLISLALGFTNGMAAGTGAICVSLADQPNPLASKIKILPFSLVLACCSSLLIALSVGHPALQGVIVVLVSAGAGLLVGYGRWALPVSVLTMLAVVFTLGVPLPNVAEALRHEALFALGGSSYLLLALAATRATETSGRRIAVAETLREFAHYLRAVAGFYDKDADLADIYRRLVEQQAALADHLQAARQQLFLGRRGDMAGRLSAAIIIQLDALDALVSTHADYAPLRRGDAGPRFPQMVALLANTLAGDLNGLANDLLRYRSRLVLPDRGPMLDQLSQEVARLSGENRLAPRSLRAARATRTKFAWVTDHLSRLPKLLQTGDAAEKLLQGIDLSAFLQPLSLSPGLLRRHVNFNSPVLRHAIRLSAAMGFGYLLISLVPYLSHGNWILLTIAVVLRAQYGVTRQRRNQRMLGNLIGCLLAAAILKILPAPAQLAMIPLAVGVAHAYLKVNYLVTSVFAAVMAILSLHFLDPTEASPILDRLLDTVIGAAIAFLFARLLPRWEYQEAPRLVDGLIRSFKIYMADALRRDISEQSYRLARKTMLESLASVTDSAGRVAGEPAHVQNAMPDLGGLLSAAYTLAAQIVGIRVLLSHRQQDIAPHFADHLLQRTRDIVLGQLDLDQDTADTALSDTEDESAIDAEMALRLRCAELCAAAVQLHEVAARYRNLAPVTA